MTLIRAHIRALLVFNMCKELKQKVSKGLLVHVACRKPFMELVIYVAKHNKVLQGY